MSSAAGATPDAGQPAGRMTLSEQNRLLFALLTPKQREHSSVAISRNAREIVQFEVTVKAGTQGLDTVEEAELVARQIFDRLELAYPRTEGTQL